MWVPPCLCVCVSLCLWVCVSLCLAVAFNTVPVWAMPPMAGCRSALSISVCPQTWLYSGNAPCASISLLSQHNSFLSTTEVPTKIMRNGENKLTSDPKAGNAAPVQASDWLRTVHPFPGSPQQVGAGEKPTSLASVCCPIAARFAGAERELSLTAALPSAFSSRLSETKAHSSLGLFILYVDHSPSPPGAGQSRGAGGAPTSSS